MKKTLIVLGCALLAMAAVGCKSKCQQACEHIKECTGQSDLECDKSCQEEADVINEASTDGEDVTRKDTKDAAKCVLDLSCEEIEDPAKLAACEE